MSTIMRIAVAAIALVIFAQSVNAQANRRGTREEAVAIVKQVKQMWRTIGPEKTMNAVNKLTHNLKNKDLYPFILHFDGYVAAHFFQAIRGLKTADDTDSEGRSIAGQMIQVARTKGRGWTQYTWPNPITKRLDAKESYVEALDREYLVAVGVFRRKKDSQIRNY